MISKRLFKSTAKSRQDCARATVAIALLISLLGLAAEASKGAPLPTGFSETTITNGLFAMNLSLGPGEERRSLRAVKIRSS
jgi:hypothetical protein